MGRMTAIAVRKIIGDESLEVGSPSPPAQVAMRAMFPAMTPHLHERF